MSKHLEYLKKTIQQTQKIEKNISDNLEKIKENKEEFESAIGVIELSKLTDEYIEKFQKELSTETYNPTIIIRDGEKLKLINMRKEILMELNENNIGDRVFFEWLEELFPLNKRLVNDEQAIITIALEKEKIYTEKTRKITEMLSQTKYEKRELTKEEEKESAEVLIDKVIVKLEKQLEEAKSKEEEQSVRDEMKKCRTKSQKLLRELNKFLNKLETSLAITANKYL